MGNLVGANTLSYLQEEKTPGYGSILYALYADFVDTNKSAINSLNFWAKDGGEGVKGTRVDLTTQVISGPAYDQGYITRSYSITLRDFTLITNRFVKIGIGLCASPGSVIDNVTSNGFLNGFVIESCWRIKLSQCNGRAYHMTMNLYNTREGFVNRVLIEDERIITRWACV